MFLTLQKGLPEHWSTGMILKPCYILVEDGGNLKKPLAVFKRLVLHDEAVGKSFPYLNQRTR